MTTVTTRHGLRGEHGFALASVVFLGAVMIILASIIVVRATARLSIDAASNQTDEALLVTEGSLDAYMAGLSTQADPDDVDTGQSIAALIAASSDGTLRTGLIEAAMAADPSAIVSAPEGEAVIIKPTDDGVVFSIGFAPTIAAPHHKVRVVSVEYSGSTGGSDTWVASHAILAGGDLDVGRSGLVTGDILVGGDFDELQRDSTVAGDIHANGTFSKGSSVTITGCATASVGSVAPAPGCPTSPTSTQTVPLGDIDARLLHSLSWYDLCPNGKRRYGPAHPTAAAAVKATSGIPCTGGIASDSSPWSGSGTTWQISQSNTITGVFYVYGSDVTIDRDVTGAGATIIVEKDYGSAGSVPDPLPACSSGTGGNLTVTGQSFDLAYAPSTLTGIDAVGLAIVVEGRLNLDRDATIAGLVASREDSIIDRSFDLIGALATLDACAVGSVTGRDMTVEFVGSITTPFTGPGGAGSGFTAGSKYEI